MAIKRLTEVTLLHGQAPNPSLPAATKNRFFESQCDIELDERIGVIRVMGLELHNGELPKDGTRKRNGREWCQHVSACRWTEAVETVVDTASKQGAKR